MSKQRYDSDNDISDKLRKLMINSEKQAKQAVTKAAKVYESNIASNTPVHSKQTHSTHAIEVLKISNFQRDSLNPTKEVGFDKGRKRTDSGWYIHFPDIGTTINGTVGQPPQHFMRRSQEMSKAPIYAIYKEAVRKMMDVD
ncbi:putative head-tail joining protein [uncultured Caudovirales phage]|uniref:Putative head-tail joining protein n=1 Tax=uncultured Caudovirales phage TaxID=2100421 RepID=A0A2H4JAI5_9CAUD|nr:putative head-tail joining protein [uncultured Caudovirales phage]